jgi:peptide/nickel transport system substrate-binding protein
MDSSTSRECPVPRQEPCDSGGCKVYSVEAGDFANRPIGSGPFRFSYRKGEKEVGLVVNEDYYRGRPSIDRVVFYVQPDKEKSWARLLSANTDLALGIDAKDYEILKRHEDRFHFNTVVEPFRTLLLFNTADPFFADPRVRTALAHGIDKEYILTRILGGQGVAAAGAMGYHSPFRNPELQPIPYNPEKSLRLLKEAGWSVDRDGRYLQKAGRRFEFTILLFAEIQLHHRVAQYLRLCLNDLGIKAHLQPVPYHELYERFWGNNAFQAVITEFKDVISADFLHDLWCPVDGKMSMAGSFEDPDVSRLIDRALKSGNHVLRMKLFHESDSLLTSLQPAMFLYQRTYLNVLSKSFQPAYPFSSLFFRFHLWDLSPIPN